MADPQPGTENHWNLVQTTTGKIIDREAAEVLEAEVYVCKDEGHYGIYFEPGGCRICGEPRIQKTAPIGFTEAAEQPGQSEQSEQPDS